ncbi:MAG: hypothetical protein IJ449_01740 [Clostridia bacterium]|nr:hypothetical protein [Clostridia bacterium]
MKKTALALFLSLLSILNCLLCACDGGGDAANVAVTDAGSAPDYWAELVSETAGEDEDEDAVVYEACENVYRLVKLPLAHDFYTMGVTYDDDKISVNCLIYEGTALMGIHDYYDPETYEHLEQVGPSKLTRNVQIGLEWYTEDGVTYYLHEEFDKDSESVVFQVYDGENNLIRESERLYGNSKDNFRGELYVVGDYFVYHFANGRKFFVFDRSFSYAESEKLRNDPINVVGLEDGRILVIYFNDVTYIFTPETGRIEQVGYCTETPAYVQAEKRIFTAQGVYFISKTGITVQRDGVDTLLCDFQESGYTPSEMQIFDIMPGDRFLVKFTDAFTGEIYPAVFEPGETTRPVRKSIRLATVGITTQLSYNEDLNTIAASVAYFNRNNKKYRIEWTDYDTAAQYDENGQYIQDGWLSDRIKQNFEMDLISGVQYDVFLFGTCYDNMDALAEKGLFRDLTALTKKADMLTCVREALSVSGGGTITAIPFSVSLSTLVTTTDILPTEEAFTYEKLYEIFDGLGEGEALHK